MYHEVTYIHDTRVILLDRGYGPGTAPWSQSDGPATGSYSSKGYTPEEFATELIESHEAFQPVTIP